jgi:UDP-N-acetylglucosamine 2-epimerase (non-hydrolysing)
MKKITIVAGARPNFVKIAPIIHAIKKSNQASQVIDYAIVHTGQHFDPIMSKIFFEELNIPEPDVNLNVNGGTQAEQTAGIMVEFEKYLMAHPTDLVIVVGDVTSTMACAIVAKKLNVKVAHVEGGIRSNDMTMPEEINRIVTDSITDYFFTTSRFANENLKNAGVPDESVFFVGNVMIDTLSKNLDRLKMPGFYASMHLKAKEYLVLTLHRPSNVDNSENLQFILQEIMQNTHGYPVIFPAHPRTRKVLNELNSTYPNLILIEPLSYLEFNFIVKNSFAVITDSGGITEETTFLNIPCLTLRDNTERPETCETGTNMLVGNNPANIAAALQKLFSGKWKSGSIPDRWDGHAAERIVSHLIHLTLLYCYIATLLH